MKIALIPPHYGTLNRGVENSVEVIAEKLKGKGHIVHIIGPASPSDITVRSLTKDKGLGKISEFINESSNIGGFARKYIGLQPHIEDISFALGLKSFLTEYYDIIWSMGEIWCANAIKDFKNTVVTHNGPPSRMMIEMAKTKPGCIVTLTPEYNKWIKQTNLPTHRTILFNLQKK